MQDEVHRKGRRPLRLILAAVMLTLGGGPALSQQNSMTVESLSAPNDWVSGGKVLIRIRGHDDEAASVRLNGKLVLAAIPGRGEPRDRMIQGLKVGSNRIEVRAGTGRAYLLVRNHDPKRPILSGPRLQPFICQTASFKLPDGATLGAPTDRDCSAPTVIQYVYKRRGADGLVPLADPARAPADADEATNLDGIKVPFVVRVETGTVNRAIYQFAVLHNPATDGEARWDQAPKGWARRLLAVHGTGCPRGWYIQGAQMGVSPIDPLRLGQGYAVFTSTLNHPTNSCNPIVAGETTLMVRQKVIETLGAPHYTLSAGGSGGAYTSLQIADAFPGLIDGVIASATFPDALSVALQGMDGRLLNHYFRELAPGKFTAEQIQAVGGYGDPSGLRGNGAQAGRTDPISGRTGEEEGYNSGVWNEAVPAHLRYNPTTNPKGARPTVFDSIPNIYGRDRRTGFALRPFDNVGVQYGLAALNAGRISVEQFIDLNTRVGGYDQDTNYVAQRSVGDPGAISRAYRSGLTLSGAGGLSRIPIIDYSGIYSDLEPRGDFHMKHHHFEVRERLRRWNGRSDNHIMWSGPARGGAASVPATMTRDVYANMDAWLMAIAGDRDRARAYDRVVRNKPAALTDGCWTEESGAARFIAEPQVHQGDTACNRLYPAHSHPRLMAAAPLSGDVLKCALKPLDPRDYKVTFTETEWAGLKAVFPRGVCNWASRGAGQQPVRPWTVW